MIYKFFIRGHGHSPLSNFFISPFEAPHFRDRLKNGEPGKRPVEFKTVEHYYQSAKAMSFSGADQIRLLDTPGETKRAGRACRLAPTWESDKFLAMRWGLEYKFAPGTELAQWLLDTGDQGLIEGNDWGDKTWGMEDGEGHNWLGYMLMAQRAWLRAT